MGTIIYKVHALYPYFAGENRLSGSIPSELGNLSNLRALHLRKHNNDFEMNIESYLTQYFFTCMIFKVRNELTGLIPSELGKLSNLESLILGKLNEIEMSC